MTHEQKKSNTVKCSYYHYFMLSCIYNVAKQVERLMFFMERISSQVLKPMAPEGVLYQIIVTGLLQ